MLTWTEHYPKFGCKLASVWAAQSTRGTESASTVQQAAASPSLLPGNEKSAAPLRDHQHFNGSCSIWRQIQPQQTCVLLFLQYKNMAHCKTEERHMTGIQSGKEMSKKRIGQRSIKISSCMETVCERDSTLHRVFQYKDLQTSSETGRRQAGNNPEKMKLCSACNSNPTAQGALDCPGSRVKMSLDKSQEEK